MKKDIYKAQTMVYNDNHKITRKIWNQIRREGPAGEECAAEVSGEKIISSGWDRQINWGKRLEKL